MEAKNAARVDVGDLEKIKRTDNSLKEGDKPGINQDPKPLTLGENSLPVDWNGGE